jgi:hypothetical protein
MTQTTKWKRVSGERFEEMLCILPPAVQTGAGFLVGEPETHRGCAATGRFAPAFAAFVEHYHGSSSEYFESLSPLTIGEFRRLVQADVLGNLGG